MGARASTDPQHAFPGHGQMKPEQFTDWIFEMNDWLLPFQQWEQVKAEDCKGRFYDPDKPWGLHTRQAYPLRAWQMRSNSPPMRETPIAPRLTHW